MSHLHKQSHESHVAWAGNFFPRVTILASYAVGETITTKTIKKMLVENFAVLNFSLVSVVE